MWRMVNDDWPKVSVPATVTSGPVKVNKVNKARNR